MSFVLTSSIRISQVVAYPVSTGLFVATMKPEGRIFNRAYKMLPKKQQTAVG